MATDKDIKKLMNMSPEKLRAWAIMSGLIPADTLGGSDTPLWNQYSQAPDTPEEVQTLMAQIESGANPFQIEAAIDQRSGGDADAMIGTMSARTLKALAKAMYKEYTSASPGGDFLSKAGLSSPYDIYTEETVPLPKSVLDKIAKIQASEAGGKKKYNVNKAEQEYQQALIKFQREGNFPKGGEISATPQQQTAGGAGGSGNLLGNLARISLLAAPSPGRDKLNKLVGLAERMPQLQQGITSGVTAPFEMLGAIPEIVKGANRQETGATPAERSAGSSGLLGGLRGLVGSGLNMTPFGGAPVGGGTLADWVSGKRKPAVGSSGGVSEPAAGLNMQAYKSYVDALRAREGAQLKYQTASRREAAFRRGVLKAYEKAGRTPSQDELDQIISFMKNK